MAGRTQLTRRDFLKIVSAAGAGLVIEVSLAGCARQPTAMPLPTAAATSAPTAGPTLPTSTPAPSPTPQGADQVAPSVYLTLSKDGLVTVTIPRSELGQGTHTALAMLLAEDLNANWSTIRIEQAPGNSAYGDQTTGGSTSINVFYDRMRRAGAVGCELMLRAASDTWGVERATCIADKNTVIHQPTGKKLAYAELVDKAAQMDLPDPYQITLKKQEDFQIIGTNIGRYENPQIVTGSAMYGLDVRLPGMLFATVARSPVMGGKLVNFDASATEKVAGVRKVVQIDCGVAVVAENTWAAMQGRNALAATWDDGPDAGLDTDQIEQDLLAQAARVNTREGDLAYAYVFPYFGHVPIEPMNCTADVRADHCEIWVPTQNPQPLLSKAAMTAGVPFNQTRVNVTLVGGGFGRRLEMSPGGSIPPEADYVSQALQISKAMGAPVQVVWSREDDLRYDLFHPFTVTRISASLEDVTQLRTTQFDPRANIPSGYWRSVTNPPEAFARESFLDEYAAATHTDPLDVRRKFLAGDKRALGVLELAAEKADWGQPLPAGYGRGIAYHSTWNATPVAEVAEVSVSPEGGLQVHRVVCAVDCGLAINPGMIVAQMESGIVFGLTAVLKENITLKNGRVQQTNFDNYPILRFDEMPVIEVYLVPSEALPTGIGEMANPPLAPAVVNAIFAATGKRIRHIPIKAGDLL